MAKQLVRKVSTHANDVQTLLPLVAILEDRTQLCFVIEEVFLKQGMMRLRQRCCSCARVLTAKPAWRAPSSYTPRL